MPRSSIRVAYVLGKGRSGSTLLDAVLGQLPGVFSAGELRTLWSWGYQQDADCSCGRPVRECPVWSRVVEAALGTATPSADRIEALAATQDRALRWREVPRSLAGSDSHAVRAYAATQARLYRGMVEVTGAEVIIDSSKWPAHPGVLGRVDGVEPLVIHLVRDPRAVAHSYRRHKPTAGRQPAMPRFGAAHSALSWLARNATVEVAARAAPRELVTYEAFAADPRSPLAAIARLLGRDPAQLPFVDDRTVRLGETHLVGGNPARFRGGVVAIRPDDEWTRALPARQARLVGVITAPLLARYGYDRAYRGTGAEPSRDAPRTQGASSTSNLRDPEPEVVP